MFLLAGSYVEKLSRSPSLNLMDNLWKEQRIRVTDLKSITYWSNTRRKMQKVGQLLYKDLIAFGGDKGFSSYFSKLHKTS